MVIKYQWSMYDILGSICLLVISGYFHENRSIIINPSKYPKYYCLIKFKSLTHFSLHGTLVTFFVFLFKFIPSLSTQGESFSSML